MKAKLVGLRLEGSNLVIEVELDKPPKEGLNDPEIVDAIKELFGITETKGV